MDYSKMYAEVITSKVLRSPLWLAQPLQSMCHKWPWICSTHRNHNSVLSSIMTYHRVCDKSNTTGATCGAPELSPVFSFLCSVLYITVCCFVFFLWSLRWLVLLLFTASDYPFGIVTLFSLISVLLLFIIIVIEYN